MTDATRQATVALALRARIAELDDVAEMANVEVERDSLLVIAVLRHVLDCWEAPNVSNAEVLQYNDERRK